MKQDVVRSLVGVTLIAGASGIIFVVARRATEGRVFRMKAPFKFPLLPYPVTSDVVSSPFGAKRPTGPHMGIDLRTRFKNGVPDVTGLPDIGMQIRSPVDGKITRIENNASGGLQMFIEADDGTVIGLAHLLTTVDLKPGDRVEAGELIAASGNSGPPGTAPHIHLSVRDAVTKTIVDPAPYLGV